MAHAIRSAHGNAGQAIVEFIVGLVAVLALLAGLIQVASLTATHTDTMIQARRLAGEESQRQLGLGEDLVTDPDYIRDWREGPDNKKHTRDDESTAADPDRLDETILSRSVPDDSGWEIMSRTPHNRIRRLHSLENPVTLFGLVHGHDAKPVTLIPAARHLFYDAETVNVECDVWMTWNHGIY